MYCIQYSFGAFTCKNSKWQFVTAKLYKHSFSTDFAKVFCLTVIDNDWPPSFNQEMGAHRRPLGLATTRRRDTLVPLKSSLVILLCVVSSGSQWKVVPQGPPTRNELWCSTTGVSRLRDEVERLFQDLNSLKNREKVVSGNCFCGYQTRDSQCALRRTFSISSLSVH